MQIYSLQRVLLLVLRLWVGDNTKFQCSSKKLLVLIDQHEPFNVMDYLSEIIKVASYDNEKSISFAPSIQKIDQSCSEIASFCLKTLSTKSIAKESN